jgi:branched-chain amino acid transport system ATP-binding protein
MLRVEGLHVSIQGASILRGVDLAVGTGQFVGLIGRNGAGKTTLVRAIMGIAGAQRGHVRFDGRLLDAAPTHARARAGLGYMPEDRRLVPALSVEENVLLPAWATGATDAKARFERVCTMIPEVAAFAQRKALQLSGGQQKLVALARALASNPKLLLLDEPFEGVAPVLAHRLGEVIRGLKQQGLSVLVCESSLSHVRDALDAIYTIDRGAVQAT